MDSYLPYLSFKRLYKYSWLLLRQLQPVKITILCHFYKTWVNPIVRKFENFQILKPTNSKTKTYQIVPNKRCTNDIITNLQMTKSNFYKFNNTYLPTRCDPNPSMGFRFFRNLGVAVVPVELGFWAWTDLQNHNKKPGPPITSLRLFPVRSSSYPTLYLQSDAQNL